MYKLTIETSLVNKINYLCNQMPNNEWSGNFDIQSSQSR